MLSDECVVQSGELLESVNYQLGERLNDCNAYRVVKQFYLMNYNRAQAYSAKLCAIKATDHSNPVAQAEPTKGFHITLTTEAFRW